MICKPGKSSFWKWSYEKGLEEFMKATRYHFISPGGKKKNPYLQIFKQGMGMICPKELFWENRKEQQHEQCPEGLRIA